MAPLNRSIRLWATIVLTVCFQASAGNNTQLVPSTTSTAKTTTATSCTTFITLTVTAIQWVISSTLTYIDTTYIPHITPYSNGTNVTSLEIIVNTSPPPSVLLSITRDGGFTCVIPTPCEYGRLTSGSCVTSIVTPESITAVSLLETPYTAPPEVEPVITVGPEQPPTPDEPSDSGVPPETQNPVRPTVSPLPPDTGIPELPQASETPAEPAPNPPQVPSPEQGGDTPPVTISGIGLISFAPSGPGILLPSATDLLEPGEATTVNGVLISLDPQGSVIVISSRTFNIPLPTPDAPTTVSGIVLPNGQTLAPGEVTTINGVPISLSPSGTVVVVDGSTITIPTSATDVWSGIGGGGPTSTPAQFTGGAEGLPGKNSEGWLGILAGFMLVFM